VRAGGICILAGRSGVRNRGREIDFSSSFLSIVCGGDRSLAEVRGRVVKFNYNLLQAEIYDE
jgi:hypothetical protein